MGDSSPVPFKALIGSLRVYEIVPLVVPDERVAYHMLFLSDVVSGTSQLCTILGFILIYMYPNVLRIL
jgi:hypothetical protein